MIGIGGLKQHGKVEAEVSGRLGPVPLFAAGLVTSSSGSGVKPDTDSGKLLLVPGVYLVMLTVNMSWARTPSVTAAVVIGGDTRFRGPRATLEAENGAEAIVDSLPPRQVEWDHIKSGTVVVWGLVDVPPGSDPVPCEVYVKAETRHTTRVKISDGELLAVMLSQHPAQGGHS